MNILSICDGISCGQVALKRAKIKIDSYYASEIDKYAIQVTQTRFPKTNQLGDMTKYKNWAIDKPDIILAGTPCQDFSIAGARKGIKGARGNLTSVFLDMITYYKPKYFLLENVQMKQEYINLISKRLKVKPILLNSSLVSAQNRNRLYWSNIPITQPKDKKVYLKDILEHGSVDRLKSYCIDANYWKGGNLDQYFKHNRRQLVFNSTKKLFEIKKGMGNRVYSINGKAATLTTNTGGFAGPSASLIIYKGGVRKLTVLECERLQTLDDHYTDVGISNTQRYKAIGNGWTVDIIKHILKGIK